MPSEQLAPATPQERPHAPQLAVSIEVAAQYAVVPLPHTTVPVGQARHTPPRQMLFDPVHAPEQHA